MKYFFILLFIGFLFTSFIPGVGTAKLSCISQSGRTLFEAEFEEYTTIRQAKLTIDKESIPFYYSDNCYVTFDPEVNVYTLNIESDANGNFDTIRYVQLWAIPSSFKEVSSQGTEFRDIYQFNAKLKARDPRKGKVFETPIILLPVLLPTGIHKQKYYMMRQADNYCFFSKKTSAIIHLTLPPSTCSIVGIEMGSK